MTISSLHPSTMPSNSAFSSSLTKSPVDSLAYRIRKTWSDASALTKKCLLLNKETLKELTSLRHLAGDTPSWQQSLNAILDIWIKEKQHDKLFKASPHFIIHCQEQFFQYVEHEEALDNCIPIAPYMILIDAIACSHPSYLLEMLFKII